MICRVHGTVPNARHCTARHRDGLGYRKSDGWNRCAEQCHSLVQRLAIPFDPNCQHYYSEESDLPQLKHHLLNSIPL
jgi:hypothetical protein